MADKEERVQSIAFKRLEEMVGLSNKCLDPFAAVVMSEALDYCINLALNKIEAAEKIFPGVDLRNAQTVELIEVIRNTIEAAPKCKPDQLEPLLPKWSAPKITVGEKPKPPKPAVAPTVTGVTIEKQPHSWLVPVRFENETFDNPTELARTKLGLKTVGTTGGKLPGSDMIRAYNNGNFRVYTDATMKVERTPDNPGSKTEGEFFVVKVGEIPEKYRLKIETPSGLPSAAEITEGVRKAAQKVLALSLVKDKDGNVIGVQDEEGKYFYPSDMRALKDVQSKLEVFSDADKATIINIWLQHLTTAAASPPSPPSPPAQAPPPPPPVAPPAMEAATGAPAFKLRKWDVEKKGALLQVKGEGGVWQDIYAISTQDEANTAERILRMGWSVPGEKFIPAESFRITVRPLGEPQLEYIYPETKAYPKPSAAAAKPPTIPRPRPAPKLEPEQPTKVEMEWIPNTAIEAELKEMSSDEIRELMKTVKLTTARKLGIHSENEAYVTKKLLDIREKLLAPPMTKALVPYTGTLPLPPKIEQTDLSKWASEKATEATYHTTQISFNFQGDPKINKAAFTNNPKWVDTKLGIYPESAPLWKVARTARPGEAVLLEIEGKKIPITIIEVKRIL